MRDNVTGFAGNHRRHDPSSTSFAEFRSLKQYKTGTFVIKSIQVVFLIVAIVVIIEKVAIALGIRGDKVAIVPTAVAII
jgi:hypothetical protein